jgi:hypothetical protein
MIACTKVTAPLFHFHQIQLKLTSQIAHAPLDKGIDRKGATDNKKLSIQAVSSDGSIFGNTARWLDHVHTGATSELYKLVDD